MVQRTVVVRRWFAVERPFDGNLLLVSGGDGADWVAVTHLTLCRLDSEADDLLRASVTELGLSARAHDKVLRVARTIADLDGCPGIQLEHLNEAINYRLLDRNLWK